MGSRRRERRGERLVRVAVAENQFTVQFLRDRLADAGIRTLVRNRDASSIFTGIGGARFALEVMVLEGDADRAAAVLAEEPVAPPALPPAPLPPPPVARRARKRRWWQ